jgi:hypothetical protein
MGRWTGMLAVTGALASGLIIAVSGTAPGAVAGVRPADTDTDTITVTSVGSAWDESGLLTIGLTASSPVTSLSAQLYAAGATTPSMTVTSFTPPGSGPQASGVWTVTSPIPWGTGPGELPLGTYSVDVTASDQGGTTITNVPSGSLALLIWPELTFAASPSTISWADRNVTFSGTVSGYYPDGSTGTVPGATVDIAPLGEQGGSTTTSGQDGTYSVTQQVTAQNWYAYVSGGPGVSTSASLQQSLVLSIAPDQVKLTANLAKADVNYGQGDTVSGVVTYENGASWQPLANLAVTIETGPYNQAVTAETNASGQFSASLPAADLDGADAASEYGVAVEAGEYNSFFDGQTQSLPVTVNWPARLARVSEKLTATGFIDASGCIVYTAPGMENSTSESPIAVDYAPTAHGPWRQLGKIRASWDGTQMCPAVGSNWTGHLPAKVASAWYRERIPASPGIEQATSAPVHLWRYLTRFTRFHVSPRSVAKGGAITVSGRLQQANRGWHALGHQTVVIVLRPKGQSAWYWIKTVRTSASGYFSDTFSDPVSATWSAVFEGDARCFVSSARTYYVRVSGTNAALMPAAGGTVQAGRTKLNRLPAGLRAA